MITKKKITIYKRYKGDVDAWQRFGRKKEKTAIEDRDWDLIDGFIQDIILSKNSLASHSYETAAYNKLIEECDNEETINQIKTLVKGTKGNSKGSITDIIFSLFRPKRNW